MDAVDFVFYTGQADGKVVLSPPDDDFLRFTDVAGRPDRCHRIVNGSSSLLAARSKTISEAPEEAMHYNAGRRRLMDPTDHGLNRIPGTGIT